MEIRYDSKPQDPSLIAAASSTALARGKSTNKTNDDADQAIRRFIEISEMDLSKGKDGQDDEHSYIDKNILSTQAVTIMAAPASSKGINSREVVNDTVPLYNIIQEKKDPADLRSIIDKMKKKESTSVVPLPERAFTATSKPMSTSSTTADIKFVSHSNTFGMKSGKTSFGLQSSKDANDSFAVVDLTQPLQRSLTSSQAETDFFSTLSTQLASSSTQPSLTQFSRKTLLSGKVEEPRPSLNQEEVIKDIISKLFVALLFQT